VHAQEHGPGCRMTASHPTGTCSHAETSERPFGTVWAMRSGGKVCARTHLTEQLMWAFGVLGRDGVSREARDALWCESAVDATARRLPY